MTYRTDRLEKAATQVAERPLDREVDCGRQERCADDVDIARFFSLDLDLLCIADTDGRFRRLNRAWQKTLGYAPEELEGTSFLALIHHDDLDATVKATCDLAEGKDVVGFVNRYRHRDGSYRWIEWRSAPFESNLIYAAARDITARIGMEEALRISELRYRTLFEQIPDGIMMLDRDFVATDCNDAMAAISGLPRERLVGMPASEARLPGDVLTSLEAAMSGRVTRWKAFPFTASDGREVSTSGLTAPVSDSDGNVTGALCVISDQTEQKRSEELIEKLAFRDQMTGLPNRTLLRDRLRQSFDHAKRSRHMMALAVLDLDHLKLINNAYGHAAGDRILGMVAARLSGAKRRQDTLARIGGDEFALLVPHVASLGHAETVATKLRTALAEPFSIDDASIRLTASVGVALYPGDANDAMQLLVHADSALRVAKAKGGDATRFYDLNMDAQASERLAMTDELRRAIEVGGQFVNYYQPQVRLSDQRVVGVEALIRWQHPERGLVSPLEFIPLAEETGLISQVGRWAVQQACRDAVACHTRLGQHLRMAVNLSSQRLHSPGIVPHIQADIAAAGLSPEHLEIEVTETAIMADAEVARNTLRALREHGMTVALDDFGTGYSSLSHLHKLPIDRIKIDRSFVSRIESDEDAAAIVKAVTQLAHTMGLSVVAEGVETEAELAFLRRIGCDEAQGYLFSYPLPLGDCALLATASSIEPASCLA